MTSENSFSICDKVFRETLNVMHASQFALDACVCVWCVQYWCCILLLALHPSPLLYWIIALSVSMITTVLT